MKDHEQDTTVSVDPGTNRDLEEIIERIQPRPTKKELLRFLVSRYKEELISNTEVAEVQIKS
jgi:hypothetical protein